MLQPYTIPQIQINLKFMRISEVQIESTRRDIDLYPLLCCVLPVCKQKSRSGILSRRELRMQRFFVTFSDTSHVTHLHYDFSNQSMSI